MARFSVFGGGTYHFPVKREFFTGTDEEYKTYLEEFDEKYKGRLLKDYLKDEQESK